MILRCSHGQGSERRRGGLRRTCVRARGTLPTPGSCRRKPAAGVSRRCRRKSRSAAYRLRQESPECPRGRRATANALSSGTFMGSTSAGNPTCPRRTVGVPLGGGQTGIGAHCKGNKRSTCAPFAHAPPDKDSHVGAPTATRRPTTADSSPRRVLRHFVAELALRRPAI
jgi:hypothetical protein